MNKNTAEIILDFINGFKSFDKLVVEALFSQGYCYWFAVILSQRFGGIIYYLPVSNHFITKIDDAYFDIHGEYTVNEPCYSWSEYKMIDAMDYKYVVKYCVYKEHD